MPKYYVHRSLIQSSNNHEIIEVTLDVVVYKSYFDECLCNEIEMEHNSINGQPTVLEINLYYSRWHLKNDDSYNTILFNYVDN